MERDKKKNNTSDRGGLAMQWHRTWRMPVLRERVRFLGHILAGFVLFPVMAYCQWSPQIAVTQASDGSIVVTLSGTTDCPGSYSIPILSTVVTSPVSSTSGGVAITSGPPPSPSCIAAGPQVTYSVATNIGHVVDGIYTVQWSFSPGIPDGFRGVGGWFFTIELGTLLQGVTFDVSSVSFPPQSMGTVSAPVAITLLNRDPVPHLLEVFETAGLLCQWCSPPAGYRTDFPFTTNCPSSPAVLAPYASCTVQLTFAPTGFGGRGTLLAIAMDLIVNNGPRAIPVSGVALGVLPDPVPTLSQWALMMLLVALLAAGSWRLHRAAR